MPAPKRSDQALESSRPTPRAFHFTFLPAPTFLQCIDNFTRHVALVVFGENRISGKYTSGLQPAFRNDALPFSKQIRDNPLVADRNIIFTVSHCETDLQIVASV